MLSSRRRPAVCVQTLKPGQAKDQRPWPIIDKVSGVLKPRRLTLLLGTPGAGRSLLMKALAGRLTFEKTLRVRGRAGGACLPAPAAAGDASSSSRMLLARCGQHAEQLQVNVHHTHRCHPWLLPSGHVR